MAHLYAVEAARLVCILGSLAAIVWTMEGVMR